MFIELTSAGDEKCKMLFNVGQIVRILPSGAPGSGTEVWSASERCTEVVEEYENVRGMLRMAKLLV